MKKILFYYPSNKRSVQIETTLVALKNEGHTLVLLTTCEKGELHKQVEKSGIQSHTSISKYHNAIRYYLFQILSLIRFCKREKVDIVFSNLQHANFIAVLAQYFMQARVIAFRHHFKFSKGNFGILLEINANEQRFDKVINQLAKHQVVPSKGVYHGMLKHEKVDPLKVQIIPYMYDFSRYPEINASKVEALTKAKPCKLRVIMVARLIPFKRHMMFLTVYKKLIESGLDLHLYILDEGPEEEKLKAYCRENKLDDFITFVGFTIFFQEYMSAADLLIHPSLTEASNNVVKEMGLLQKGVAVCKGVGDFDDYIVDGHNGFLMQMEDPRDEMEQIIRRCYADEGLLPKLGTQLKQSILHKFGNNEAVLKQYQELIQQFS